MAVNPIPEGYHSVTPYLIVRGAAKALEFYKKAFGAEEIMRMESPGGKIAHAEIQIGNSRIMLADEHPEMDAKAPESFGGSPISLLIYCKDVDGQVKTAVEAGARIVRAVKDQFYGDRMGTIKDPFGHSWTIGTHIEDLTPEQMKERAAKAMAEMPSN